ncbi:MAG TPA: hypothetical protein VIL85_21705 [Thermomicrobiales bacterium]|jgi:hypothetical protein
MSVATKPLHSPAELTLIGCDDRTGIADFQSDSEHDAARINTTALDTTTGAILCDCKGAEFGRVCWHQDHVVTAWHQSPAMRATRFLSPVALLNQGCKAAAMVTTYRARCGRPLQDDVLTLVASRSEWRQRVAQAAALAPTLIQDARGGDRLRAA